MFANAINAQDYAPVNWQFNKMSVGSAEEIFIREMGSTNWNCKAPFRLADDGEGGIGLSCAPGGDITGPGSDVFEGVTEADKAVLDEFYKAARIVNGGSENLLCLAGKSATATYLGSEKCTKSLPNATLFWLSGTDMPLDANYRLTIDYRAIADSEGEMALTLATSAYDGVDEGPSYRTYSLPVIPAFNDYWNRAILDFNVKDNTDAEYKELPIVIKMWLGNLYDNSVILFRAVKLEKIDEINPEYVPGTVIDCDFVDNPGSGINEEKAEDVLVWGNDGNITVVDAKYPVEVYTTDGMLLNKTENNSTLVNIPVNKSGVYVVKCGNTVKKIIL